MTLYTVLEAPDGALDKVAFVPEGFSWGAFLVTVVWALWERMWVVAALLIAVFTSLNLALAGGYLPSAVATALQFGIALLFGLEGRMLQVMSLQRSGYRATGLIRASSLEAAELAYFAGRAPQARPREAQPVKAARPPRSAGDDTLGLFGHV